MRIYSNKLLSLPHILHTLHINHKVSKRLDNLHIFHVKHVQPIMVINGSPLDLLCENRKYYCYDNFYRNKYIEKLGNSFEIISKDIDNIPIYIPSSINLNDVILIHNNELYDSSLNVPSWLKFYSPALL